MKTKYFTKAFNSLDEYSGYLAAGIIQPLFDRGASTASVAGRASWAGTKDLEEANYLLRFGDVDNARRLVGGVTVPGASLAESIRARRVRCVAGSSVNVPAALSGRPKSMYKIVRKNVPAKVVNICYDTCTGCDIKASDMSAVAVKLANVILSVERAGYQVNLYAAAVTKQRAEVAGCFVRVKSAGQYCDITRLAYCLVNPSFLRRSFFRFMEVTPGLSEPGWVPGYGSADQGPDVVTEAAAAAGLVVQKSFNFYGLRHMSEGEIARAVLGS